MSTSRLEKFIYAICSMEVSDLPAPLSRIEILWNCLITGETPDFEPQSRNEQYLMAMLGLYKLENLPTPLNRGEKLLYKIAMGETDLSDIPAYLSRYEELLGYLVENGGIGTTDFEYILQTLNQRLSTLYSTKEQPMKQAVIKGDTLVNELPKPSLKNTMTNVTSQKLNKGYDNGKTLVNLATQKNKRFNGTRFLYVPLSHELEINTRYFVNFNVKESTLTEGVVCRLRVGTGGSVLGSLTSDGIITVTSEGYNYMQFYIENPNDIANGLDAIIDDIMLIEYQDGMENWDIPYFEGTKTFSATPNVVDGEFKQAVVKGQTLVNLLKKTTVNVEPNQEHTHISINTIMTPKSGKYIMIYNVKIPTSSYNVEVSRCTPRIDLVDGTALYHGYEDFNTTKGVKKWIFTANSDIREVRFWINGNAEPILVEDFILLEYQQGMENWDIPYFEGMQSVRMPVLSTIGKNLFDGKFTKYEGIYGYYYLNNGTYTCSITDNDTSVDISKLSFGVRDTGIIWFFDEGAMHNTKRTITNGKLIFYPNTEEAFNKIKQRYHIQVEEGTQATAYEPFKSNILTVNEPIELRGIGDVQDTLNCNTGEYMEHIGEVMLDGVNQSYDSYGIHSANSNLRYIIGQVSNPCKFTGNYNRNTCVSDKISTDYGYAHLTDSDWGEGIALNSRHFKLVINLDRLSSDNLDGVKTYLSQNPITIQYELATPVVKTVNPTITDQDGATQTKLHSFNDGHLSVSSQGLLPSAVNYEVPTNNSYYLPDILTLGAQYTARGSADCHATIDGKLLALGKNKTFTTPSSVTDKLMVLDTAVDDLMFIKGDQTAKDFGYFERMKSVEMNGIQVTGKNKFNGVSYIDAFIGPNMNINADRDVVSIFLNVEKNTDYILSSKTYFDRGIIGGSTTPIMIRDVLNKITSSRIDNTITFNSSDYTHIMIYLNSTKINLEEIQVEKGSVATPYEPYKSTNLTLNEPVTLRKVGDEQDTLDCFTGEVVERIGEVVLDGSEDWKEYSTNSVNTYCGVIRNDIITDYKGTVYLNNKLNKLDDSDIDIEGIRINSSKRIFVRLNRDKGITDLTTFKQYLSQNPITIQYEMVAESIKTVDLTIIDQDGQPTKLKTFNDITHVEIKADNLIPSVDLEVATKISETLAMLDPQHHDISDTQNKLGQTIDEQTENTDATMMATTEIYENL